jgi:hypothetical protein
LLRSKSLRMWIALVFAVGPATLQVCGTIDVIVARASEGEVVAQGSIRELIDPLFHKL